MGRQAHIRMNAEPIDIGATPRGWFRLLGFSTATPGSVGFPGVRPPGRCARALRGHIARRAMAYFASADPRFRRRLRRRFLSSSIAPACGGIPFRRRRRRPGHPVHARDRSAGFLLPGRRILRPVRERGHAGGATTLQNTNRSTVTVYYRFHAYAGQQLEVIHYPVRRCEWVIVRTPRGTSLKIPQWMVQPSASEIVISPHAILSTNCLARLMELVPGPDLKEPSATVPETEQEGQSATASTQSRQRGEHRAGSNRRKATGRAHGEGDARGSSRKGDR